VTGVLVVLTGNATNIMSYTHTFNKEYVGVGELHAKVKEARVRGVMKELIGEIYQRPPVRSAVSRRLRTREIYYFDLLEMKDRRVLFKVGTESGTYARKLINDLGLLLGTGAHMAELRRTLDGPFVEQDARSMWDVAASLELYRRNGDDSLLRKIFLPVETAVSTFPSIYIKDSAVASVCHGASLAVGGISSFEAPIAQHEIVAVKTLKGELVAMGRASKDDPALAADKAGMAVVVERVVMDRNLYPKMWR
jgi:H/ACA ribonucleoprotein complex subunit 4